MIFKPNQDIIYQEVKLYIEGVQIPFISIQITSGIGMLPTAVISVPPFPGLMDICRYYQPKVHIFYADQFKDKDQDSVLFLGHIASTSYSRSRAGSGYSEISFQCNHKNAQLTEVLMDFSGPMMSSDIMNGKANDSAIGVNAYSSDQAVQVALQGIEEATQGEASKLSVEPDNTEGIQAIMEGKDTTSTISYSKLNSKWVKGGYANRFRGFPGVMMNLWNQYKIGAMTTPRDYQSLIMYINLIEEGIKYFDRMTGHDFIEKAMTEGKCAPCTDSTTSNSASRILVPPSLRLYVMSSVQTDLTIQVISQALNYTGELIDFLSVFSRVMERIDYEIITLTSPIEISKDPDKDLSADNTEAIETIVKPQLPFYYAPACNVYYPFMYGSIQVMQDEANIPTRINLTMNALPTPGNTLHKNYRAPHSVREAIVAGYAEDKVMDQSEPSPTVTNATPEEMAKLFENANLLASTAGAKNVSRVGRYEWGRGVKARRLELPFWLSLYTSTTTGDQAQISTDALDIAGLQLLKDAWEFRYGVEKAFLNPYNAASGIEPHERLLFSTADYRFTMAVAASRMGSLTGIFNPYIIPGYPMEILDPSPVNPCFHALCSSVTHSITANSISTSVNFVAATTYTEMSRYYLHFINPWLQVKLQIVAKTGDNKYTASIVNNSQGNVTAGYMMYKPTLGVDSMSPDDLYDFEKGVLRAMGRDDVAVSHGEQREENPNLSATGNLLLVSRPIESKASIEKRFDYKFVDMVDSNYGGNTIKYTDTTLTESEMLEPGESIWLTYSSIPNKRDAE